jgi:hypothetical protein
MDKNEVLGSINFGGRTAEEEADNLRRIFVETDQWQQVNRGDIDVVYGAKGSGKSAIYSLLQEQKPLSLRSSRIVVAAENPRGATAFRDLEMDPPTSEKEFVELWKIYLLTVVADIFPRHSIRNEFSYKTASILKDAGLFQPESTLSEKLKSAALYVKRVFRSFDIGVEVDPLTGTPRASVKPVPPVLAEDRPLAVSPDKLLEIADQAFLRSNFEAWICIDRLDVAFEDSIELEANALRALFKVYLDLTARQRIRLKIFLRSDIWRRITDPGFREASHITKTLTIVWSPDQLLNLIMKRLLQSEKLLFAYAVERPTVLADIELQKKLFYRIFPAQVEVGPKERRTWEWILSRTQDGTGSNAPRELIHLMIAARRIQLQQLDIGQNALQADQLFSSAAIRDALKEVSKVRLEQTIFAEHPRLKPSIAQLEGEKTYQTIATLSRLWGTDEPSTIQRVDELVQIGVLERAGKKNKPEYRIPFLYRDALHCLQGRAG